MDPLRSARRRFLKNGAALTAAALGATGLADGQQAAPDTEVEHAKAVHAYGQRSRFEKSIRTGNNSRYGIDRPIGSPPELGMRSPLQDLTSIITPAPLHYMISHSYEAPDINPADHRLMIHGLVDRPMTYTVAELKRLPSVSQVHFVECRANSAPSAKARIMPTATAQDTHGLSSCSMWTGVPLSLLLQISGVQSGASWIVAEGMDAQMHSKSIPLVKALDDCLVVYGQNGEAVRPEQGYPLRLLAPGYQGINNVKWLRRIKVVDKPYMFKREISDYTELRPDGKGRWFDSQMGPNSVIIQPSGRQKLPVPGYYEIRGLAWSGGGAIRRVEVSTDGGKNWKDAELKDPVYRKAYTMFGLGWNWDGQETLLKSRSTDERGDVQPSIAEYCKIWNMPPSAVEAGQSAGNFCVIQTWKVTREGSVENALFS